VSKATGVPLAKVAARLMAGRKLSDFGLPPELPVKSSFVKSPVFPFLKFPGVDTILGPEMKSTGEVMGVAESFGLAFAKAQLAAGHRIPLTGRVFISVSDPHKSRIVPVARGLAEAGFRIIATRGTMEALRAAGLKAERVFKVNEGRPNVVDRIKDGRIDLLINTPLGRASRFDEKAIRRAAVQAGLTCITTLSAAAAAVNGIREQREKGIRVASLQELHESLRNSVQALSVNQSG
jgi:carbamoyl-phosphate synthase large subunit